MFSGGEGQGALPFLRFFCLFFKEKPLLSLKMYFFARHELQLLSRIMSSARPRNICKACFSKVKKVKKFGYLKTNTTSYCKNTPVTYFVRYFGLFKTQGTPVPVPVECRLLSLAVNLGCVHKMKQENLLSV